MGFIGKAIKKIWEAPKVLSGALLLSLGIGVSFIPVPGTQAVGGKMMIAGGTAIITGLIDKGVRFQKAEKGKKWVAVTEHERKLLTKLKKEGE